MSIDSGIWVAIAAVAAALISAIISTVNMVISKDQKTTEFRQEWINSLRLELASLIALARSVKSRGNIIGHIDATPNNRQEAIKQLNDAVKTVIKELDSSYTRILLYLNPKEHVRLISLLDTLVSITSMGGKAEIADIKKQCQLVVEESQKVLKTEWKIVKRGEITFFLTKYLLFASLAYIFIFGILKLGGIIDVSFVAGTP